MSGGTPKNKGVIRVESEIERHREEGLWDKVLELSANLSSDQQQLIQFLTGEAKLEKFLESGKDPARSVLLMDAKRHLNTCLNSAGASPLAMDTNLLLSKAHFVNGEYAQALRCIELSGIEPVTRMEKTLPLRVMKLVAESFAVKGMSLEKEFPEDKEDDARNKCLQRASELSLRYLQNMDKSLGSHVKIYLGNILETAIQRGPMLYIQNKNVKKAIGQYRSFLNAMETISSEPIRQAMSRQLVEVILRGVSSSHWPDFEDSITKPSGPWKPHRYIGQSIFIPKNREEELILLLLISERLAGKDVYLDRGADVANDRNQSLEPVCTVLDLISIALVPMGHYYTDCYERAMKFSWEVKHTWFQFALTLTEAKKTARAIDTLKLVAGFDNKDPLPLLIAAKLSILELNDYHSGLQLAMEAYARCMRHSEESISVGKMNHSTSNQPHMLYARVCCLIGVAHCLLYECKTADRLQHLKDGIKFLKQAISANVNDHVPYFHLALLMAHQRAIQDALGYAQIALQLNPVHLPTIKLIILCLSSLKQYKQALDVCDAALQEYPDHLILLYIKCHLECVCEDGQEAALGIALHMLEVWKKEVQEERNVYRSNSYLTGHDTISVRLEQTLSEITSQDGSQGPEPSNISHSNAVVNGADKPMTVLNQNIWLMIVEIFLRLGKLDEAEDCVNEGVQAVFSTKSYKKHYIKGLVAKAKGDLHSAKHFFMMAISINSTFEKALQQLGHTYYLLGNHLAADKYLRDSLTCDSTLHETWAYMGQVLEALNDNERALECLETALQLEASAPVLPFSTISRLVLD